MPNFIDLTGQRFGRLTVIKRAPDHFTGKGNKLTMWGCVCDCGNTRIIQSAALRYGATKSCGCYSSEVKSRQLRALNKKKLEEFGHSREKLYATWNAMKQRCYNTKQSSFKNYGANRITLCDEWVNDYCAFKEWATNNGWKPGLSIDRIDPYKGYSPSNCRWATMKEQQNNKRINIVVEMRGERHTIAEWSDILGINYSRVYRHVKKGLSGDALYDKLTKPKGRGGVA